MTDEGSYSPEAVLAREVLLDALEALGPHRDALVLVGAQAVYLRTADYELPIAAHTVDGDLTLNPGRLGDEPDLGAAMRGAGFELKRHQGAPEPGVWVRSVGTGDRTREVPIDLIVPEAFASPEGSRGARLGAHGSRAARKIGGLEAALIDNDSMRIETLDGNNPRVAAVRVAGIPALLMAKAHKLGERLRAGREDRLSDKDAVDVFRLMGASRPSEAGQTLRRLQSQPVAGPSVERGIHYLLELFGRSGSRGVAMAMRGAELAVDPALVQGVCTAYCRDLAAALEEPSL